MSIYGLKIYHQNPHKSSQNWSQNERWQNCPSHWQSVARPIRAVARSVCQCFGQLWAWFNPPSKVRFRIFFVWVWSWKCDLQPGTRIMELGWVDWEIWFDKVGCLNSNSILSQNLEDLLLGTEMASSVFEGIFRVLETEFWNDLWMKVVEDDA